MHTAGWGTWSVVPLLWVGLLVAAGWYVSMMRRVKQATGKSVRAGHYVPYFLGLLVLLIALGSPLNTLAVHWLLLAHMLQHTLLSDIAPPLIILGLRAPVLPLGVPKAVMRRFAPGTPIGRIWSVATRPAVAVPVWAVTLVFWSVPSIFDYTVQHQLLHNFEHFMLFYTGMALWWAIIAPLPSGRRDPGMTRVVLVGLSRAASALVCLPLTFLNTTLYSYYAHLPRGYSISPINDQRLAGASMCLIEFLVFGIAAVVVFVDTLGRNERADALAEFAASHR